MSLKNDITKAQTVLRDTMTKPDFDTPINRIGTNCSKWDALESIYKIPADEGLAMWVADMEFHPPQAVLDELTNMVDHGVFGYYGDQTSYKNAIASWMARRHQWTVDPAWIFTTHGLVNAVAFCVQTWTKPSEAVILFTPVYHAFARTIKANGRRVHESPLVNTDGRYTFDLSALEASLQGDEKMLIFCSPHNPGGRVWTREELQGICDFCIKHNLLLVSDEIHHDLVFGNTKHTVMAHISEAVKSRLVMLTASSKTFNMAGAHCGNVIIEDAVLRNQFDETLKANGISPNSFGIRMTEAAYKSGDEWLEALLDYLTENRRVFDAGINAIPGLHSMALEATYLAWVDFSGTGMDREEFTSRVERVAKIAANHGPTFGSGGENFMRFNIACPRAQIEDAVKRMGEAFADLQ
ncbi:MAG: MalY/PatB family protein [Ahrensia sp.]|nr:MalY/PatB family protein [Ahrensia sp.]